MKSYKVAILILISIMSTPIFAGGGWTKKKGKSYIKVSGWWIESKNFFNGQGFDSSSNVDRGLFNVNVYLEYGISDKLTAIGYIPFFSRAYENREVDQDGIESPQRPGGDLNTFGDSEVGLKYQIYKNSAVSLAGSVILGLPFGDPGSSGEVPALATGDGEFNQILRFDAGFSILNNSNFSLYGNTYVGFNNRTEGFSDEFRFGAELGAGLIENSLWLVQKLDLIESFENGDEVGQNNSGGSIFANNTEVMNLTTEIAYNFTKKLGIAGSVAIPVSGSNVFADPAYSVGLYLDIK